MAQLPELSLRFPALQSSALLTELILPRSSYILLLCLWGVLIINFHTKLT